MIIYGKNVAKETLANNRVINKILLSKDFNDNNILNMIKNKKINIEYVLKSDMDKMVKENHQGIILYVPDYEYVELDELLDVEKPFLVILDHIEDPHNFGAIIRTCEAAGVDGIIIPKDRSVSVNSTVMKTSAGALNNVKISKVTNLNRTIDYLKDKGVWIVGTDMDDSVSYNELDYDIPIAIVIGSEGFGISKLVREKCDYVVNIPMKGKINSLNASVAAGILIYKIFEKRNLWKKTMKITTIMNYYI